MALCQGSLFFALIYCLWLLRSIPSSVIVSSLEGVVCMIQRPYLGLSILQFLIVDYYIGDFSDKA